MDESTKYLPSSILIIPVGDIIIIAFINWVLNEQGGHTDAWLHLLLLTGIGFTVNDAQIKKLSTSKKAQKVHLMVG